MTEESKDLEFQTGGIPLTANRWYTYLTDKTQVQAFLNFQKEIEDKLKAGTPVYVQIKDERRKGSVGRLNKVTFQYQPNTSSRYSYYPSHDYGYVKDIEVVWDGRKNKCAPESGIVEYLPNWTGGTQWEWNPGESKPKPERVIPYDALGQEIETGQFVCFVHRLYGRVSMNFGTVSRLTDKGGVFVKTLKLRDGEVGGKELKAFEAQHLVIVNDKLMSRLMLARLSAD